MSRSRVLAVTLLLAAPTAAHAEDPAAQVAAEAAGVVVLRGAQVGGPIPPPEPPLGPTQRRATRPAPQVMVMVIPIQREPVYAAPAWGYSPFFFTERRHRGRHFKHAGFGKQRPGGRHGSFGKHRPGGRHGGFGPGYTGNVHTRHR